ncbi:MAG: hypothetical protein Q9213_003263 [Squamulea squamosa]
MPEHHINQDPERKSSMIAKDKAKDKTKPHVRACESCRTRKIRCLPQDSSKDAKCQRCAKSGRECIYSSPEKRKRRKRTDARVADLEQMVQMLAARLEQEQRARLQQEERDHQPRSQDKVMTDQETSHKLNILSPPPSPNEYPHPETGSLPNANADQHQLLSPKDTMKPSLVKEQSTRKPIYDTLHTAIQSPLPRTTALSPSLVLQEPLSSPLSQNCIPDVTDQRYATWPSIGPFLEPEPHHQSTTTEDVYSPCPSHSSTLSHSDTCSSEMSQDTILEIPAHENNNIMFELPTSGNDFNSMDAAISAQLNMPCQDQDIWWPQSNIMCNDFPSEAAPIGDWVPREDVFSWQTTRWV